MSEKIIKEVNRRLKYLFEAKETYLYLSFFRNLEEMINEVNENEIFLMMLYDGYLTIKEKVGACSYSVKLPNKEIQLFFNLFFHK